MPRRMTLTFQARSEFRDRKQKTRQKTAIPAHAKAKQLLGTEQKTSEPNLIKDLVNPP